MTPGSGSIDHMVKLPGSFPLKGTIVWLTPEQGGRSSGPPPSSADWDYAATAFVPPHTAETGLASFVVRSFKAGAWRSPAEAIWLVVENDDPNLVEPGSVVVVTEGLTAVAYFHVERVVEER